MSYIGNIPLPQATEARVEVTATSGQTSFTGLSYVENFLDVFLNGVKLASSDFTATDGNSCTLASGAASGDIVAFVSRTKTSALVALPLKDSSGAAILSESGSTVTLANVDTATIGSNALVVNSSGEVGLGTSSISERLEVNGRVKILATSAPTWDTNTRFWTESGFGTRYDGYQHRFDVGNSRAEAMRIDTSGNVLVNASSFQGGSTVGIQLNATNNASNAYAMLIKNSDGTEIFQFKCNGSASSTTGTWGSTSDINLKENIIDATNKLSDVLKLKVKNFNFKSDPEKTKYIGFIAQELETIFPNLVEEGVDEIKSVKTSILIPILTKAIQEQQALIESQQSQIDALTARIEALEAN